VEGTEIWSEEGLNELKGDLRLSEGCRRMLSRDEGD
jgi:hypothetical protein